MIRVLLILTFVSTGWLSLVQAQTVPPPPTTADKAPVVVLPAVVPQTTSSAVPPPPKSSNAGNPLPVAAPATTPSAPIAPPVAIKGQGVLPRPVIDSGRVGYPNPDSRQTATPVLPSGVSPSMRPQAPSVTIPPVAQTRSSTRTSQSSISEPADAELVFPGASGEDVPQTRMLPGLGRAPGSVDSGRPQIIRMTNGVNHLVRFANDHPNRIVVPFRKPRVVDDGIEHIIVGNSIYVRLTAETRRGTLFIHDDADPAASVATITFVGASIPAQTVMVQFDSVTAVEERTNSDYLSNLKALLRTVVRGGEPNGYTVETINNAIASSSVGIEIQPERRWSGTRTEVLRYRIRNVSNQTLTLSEEMFGSQTVRAVAFHPNIQLQPGASTYAFIVNAIADEEALWQSH